MISQLAARAAVKQFGANQQILIAGETCKQLFIVKSGLIRILKKILKPTSDTSKLPKFDRPDATLGTEAPGAWVMDKSWKDRVGDGAIGADSGERQLDFIVGVLGSGQVFGELSILDPTIPSPVTVVTSTQVEVYSFDSDILIELGARFNHKTMNALNESINVHNPPTDKMAYYFRSKCSWETRKVKLLKQLRSERKDDEKMNA